MKYGIVSLCLWLCVSMAKAQQTGALNGRVIYRDSIPAASASIRLLNTAFETLTNARGQFMWPSILPGRYLIETTSAGHAPVVTEVNVLPGANPPVLIMLRTTYDALAEVVVTAEKKEMPVQQVPFSVSALNAAKVAEFRMWDLGSVTAVVPNLYSADPGDNRHVTTVRGIGTTSYDPAVATYVDGVSQFNLDTYLPQLTDVERIEVLRGPQGTLYGRNALGGVIQVITKKPSDRTTWLAESNIGNYGTHRHLAGVKSPLIAGKLYIGTVWQFQRRKGYHENLFNGTDFDRQHILTGNHTLRYTPTPQWDIALNIKHQANRNRGAFPLAPDMETAFREPYRLEQNAVATMKDDGLNASLSATWTKPRFRLSMQTAFQSNRRIYDAPLDGDFSPLDIVSIRNDFGKPYNRVTVWTQELRLSSPAAADTRLQWTGGMFLYAQDNPVRQATIFGADAGLFGLPDVNFSLINQNLGKSQGMALFGQFTYALSGKWFVTAGIRGDAERKSLSVRAEYLKEPGPSVTILPDTSASARYGALSPKLGLQYRMTEMQQLHLTYSRGFRTGGLTTLGSDPSQPPLFAYDPEYSDNVEAGWKTTMADRRLRVNLTAFMTLVRNAQIPTLLLPDAITVTRNAGTLNSKGIELETEATPIRGLSLMYTLGITDARYGRLRLSENGSEAVHDGNRQVFAPSHTSMLAAQYTHPLSDRNRDTKLILRGEWFHLGSQYFDLANKIRQSPYSLINARVGISTRHAALYFWIRNLADTRYVSYAYDFGAVRLGPPRTYGLTLTLNN